MEYLRPEIINKIIKLAQNCYPSPPNNQGAKRVYEIGEEMLEFNQDKIILVDFINSLSDNEKIELLALMWLGRDGGDWDDHIEYAKNHINHVGPYMAEKAPLADYLHNGLEMIEYEF